MTVLFDQESVNTSVSITSFYCGRDFLSVPKEITNESLVEAQSGVAMVTYFQLSDGSVNLNQLLNWFTFCWSYTNHDGSPENQGAFLNVALSLYDVTSSITFFFFSPGCQVTCLS